MDNQTTYAYDSNGNRLSKTEPDGTVNSGGYDNQDRLLTYGDISYAYNSNGDLTSKTQNNATVTYDYDVFGNLRKVILDNGQVIEYVIDGRNRRVGKKIDGTLVQGFLFDDQLRPIAELDGFNQVASAFVYGTHVNVPELIVKGGTTYRIVHDHLGSPRLVIDQGSGAIVQRMDYDEWGIVTLDANPGFQPFGFAGGIYDSQTKLLRFGFRDYDSAIGRWTNKDPILFKAADTDLYAYLGGNPVDEADPLGLCGSGPWTGPPDLPLNPTPTPTPTPPLPIRPLPPDKLPPMWNLCNAPSRLVFWGQVSFNPFTMSSQWNKWKTMFDDYCCRTAPAGTARTAVCTTASAWAAGGGIAGWCTCCEQQKACGATPTAGATPTSPR